MENIFKNAKFIKAKEYNKEFSLFDPLPVFRREFNVESDVKNSIIAVQSPGFARYYINGVEITSDLFISPTSNYCKLLWYNVYDVTNLLKRGKNTISVIAGNGFFNEPFITAWDYQESPWRSASQFILSLYVDGNLALVSDESWKYSKTESPIIYSHLRSGEFYDARKNTSWALVGYDDGLWNSVDLVEISPDVRFLETKCQPVTEVEKIAPVSITKNDRGYLVDFGKNTSGYVELTLTEEVGKEILIRYSEEIDKNLHSKISYVFYNEGLSDSDAGRYNEYKSRFYPESPFQISKIIASGKKDTIKPKFCYFGFRYVEIEGLTTTPKKEDITAYFVSQNVIRTADFTSGNEILNFIYTAGIRSTKSNMFWGLTDCPTREKLGWTNDAASTTEQALINFDVKLLFEKWFTDLKVDMRNNGSLPGIIPSNGWGDDWGPVCDSFLFELPYRTFLYTGDKQILIDAIPYFNRYIDFLSQKSKNNHEFILGDWLGYDNSSLTPKEFVRDFYLIKALRVTVKAYALKGNDCSSLKERLTQLEKDFIKKYNYKNGKGKVDSQTALSMMICYNLAYDVRVLKKQLIKRVEKDNFTLTCGMVGVQYLYTALSLCGKPDYAFKIITESEPGYKTWYDAGATTLWECWDGVEKGSHNHHMFSGVIAWFFKSLLGVNVTEDEPAYKSINLTPCFIKDIGYVKGRIQTPYGKIEVEWSYDGSGFNYKVSLPKEITAYYGGQKLTSQISTFYVKEEK